MLPAIAASMSASSGCGVSASNAAADINCPDWQYPHCGTSCLIHAVCSRRPSGVAPSASIVVTDLPLTPLIGKRHERVATLSTWTVQEPHNAAPQPNFVPIIPSTSRSTHSNGVSSSTSRVWVLPLIVTIGREAKSADEVTWSILFTGALYSRSGL